MSEKFTGELKVEKYEQADEKPKGSKKEKSYSVMFKQNRTFELKVGRELFVIPPYGVIELTEQQFRHPDFEQQKKYFAIKEN